MAVDRVRGGREVVAVAGEVRDAPLVAVDAVDEGRGRGGGGIAGVRAGVRTSASKSSIRRFVITEKAPTRAFSWLKAATTAFTDRRI